MANRKELSQSEMIQYLKTLMELEVSVYTQKKLLKEAAQPVYKPCKRNVEKEEVWVYYPSKPVKPPVNNDHKIVLGIGISFVGVALILSILSAAPYLQAFLYIVGAIGLALSPIGFKAEKSAEVRYLLDLNKYEKEMAETKAKHEALIAAAEEDYQKRTKEAEDDYIRRLQNYEEVFPIIKQMEEQMEEQLEATEDILEDMYSLDILYPKYRDMIAVSAFYEYFATERVTKLTGSNGAYNLYEQELRMDLVINKLDVIISELENIKDNQYALYRELIAARKTLNKISANLSELVDSAHRAEKLAGITAYCSQVIAQNTEALKYLALIS